MEAFLTQVAATARKASDQGYCKQGRPLVQEKSAAAGRPLKTSAGRQRSRCAPATNNARKGNEEHNTHSHKALNRDSCTQQCHSALCHLRSAVLHGRAQEAERLQAAGMYNAAAVRLPGECRKLALALQACRSSA